MAEGTSNPDGGSLHRQRLDRHWSRAGDLLQHPIGAGPRSWLAPGGLDAPAPTAPGLPALDRAGDVFRRGAGGGPGGLGDCLQLLAGLQRAAQGARSSHHHQFSGRGALPDRPGHPGQAARAGHSGSRPGGYSITRIDWSQPHGHGRGGSALPSSDHLAGSHGRAAGHPYSLRDAGSPRKGGFQYCSDGNTHPQSAFLLWIRRSLSACSSRAAGRLGAWRFERRSRST